MKLICLQENLKRGLAIIGRAVASKSTLPVLNNVLLATDAGRLKLAATNLEIGITSWVGAKVIEQGAITAPARLLTELVSNLPNDAIQLSIDDRTQTLHLESARSTVEIKGIAAEEFPIVPSTADHPPVLAFDAYVLREAIRQVAFAAADDDSRPILAGVFLHGFDHQVTFTATNSFRVSMRTIDLSVRAARAIDVIVPTRALIELARLLGDADRQVEGHFTASGGQMLFQTERMSLVSRLIEGRYPDVTRIIPRAPETRAVVDRQALASVVKLAASFASASANITRLTFEPGADQTPGTLTVSASAAELGGNQNVLDAHIEGPGGKLLLNAAFLSDALDAVGASQVAVEFHSAISPVVFRPVGGSDFLHMIMPMQMR